MNLFVWSLSWQMLVCFAGSVETKRLISAGGRFRLPIWRNRWLCIWGAALYGTFAALLLTPPSQFAAVFHIASIDFNSPGTANPVWQAYQDAGGQPSAGMSFDFRLKLFIIFAVGN
eukprot:COSAG06_NODE_9592_length_1863_cov_6.656463_3_plen_116_part_00